MTTKLMKYLAPLLLIAGFAFAVTYASVDRVNSYSPQHFVQGFYVGNDDAGVTASTANRVTRMLSATATLDIATVTATCEAASTITVLGANVGDPCSMGLPTSLTGAGTGLAASFSCYVSAANVVSIRHCAFGVGADNPASASYTVRVISSTY